MRKVYCDLCGNKYNTKTKSTFREPFFDYLHGQHSNKKLIKILTLIYKEFDLCDSCAKWWKMEIEKIMEDPKNEKES